MKDQLHPTVRGFQNFINQHPELIKEIRKNGSAWQTYYEKWLTDGEFTCIENKSDEKSSLQGNSANMEFIEQIQKYLDKVDLKKVESQMTQIGKGLSSVHDVLSKFIVTKRRPPAPKYNLYSHYHPFMRFPK